MTNEQKKQFHADKITALSKMIAALQAIAHTNDQEDKWIASRVKQLRWDLDDANDQFEDFCEAVEDEKQQTFKKYVEDFISNFAPKCIDADRFRESLDLRVTRFISQGYRVTHVGYGGNTDTVSVYFYNDSKRYTLFAKWQGQEYGTWCYGGGQLNEPDLQETSSLKDLFTQAA